MKLISIQAMDFCGFGHMALELDGQGLVWVGGTNLDTDSAKSNGSGKTTLFKAITWALYGKTVDGKDGDEVIRDGTKMATVSLKFHDGDGEWIIERTRRKAQPRVRLMRAATTDIWKGSRADIDAKIIDMMGLDFQGFRNTVLYGQGETKRFTDPATKDSVRKEMLHGILRTSVYKGCHEWAKAENLKLKRQQATLEGEVSEANARIDEHDIEELERLFSEHDEYKAEQAQRLADEARELLAKARAASGKNDEALAIRSKVDGMKVADEAVIDDALATVESDRADAIDASHDLVGAKSTAVAVGRSIQARLDLLDGDNCPTCSAPLDTGAPAKLIKRDKKALNANAYEVGTFESAIKGNQVVRERLAITAKLLKDRQRYARETKDEIADLLAEAASLAAQADQAMELAAAARDKAGEAKAMRDSDNPYEDQLAKSKAKVAEYELQVKKHEAMLIVLNKKRAHYEFWVRGFSDQGLPSFILDSVMPYITERANHYLGILADGDITMAFSTQRELKSSKGEMRDEIDISWNIEGLEGHAPSGGQLKKMEIATDLALMDLVSTREGAHLDILLLDELLDGLDKEGQHRVVRLLYELRKTRSSVFVISHDEDVSGSFERTVEVIKEDGVSRMVA